MAISFPSAHLTKVENRRFALHDAESTSQQHEVIGIGLWVKGQSDTHLDVTVFFDIIFAMH